MGADYFLRFVIRRSIPDQPGDTQSDEKVSETSTSWTRPSDLGLSQIYSWSSRDTQSVEKVSAGLERSNLHIFSNTTTQLQTRKLLSVEFK